MKFSIKELFQPFGTIPKSNYLILIVAQIIVALVFLQLWHSPVIPAPSDIFSALLDKLSSSELYSNLFISTEITLESMIISVILTAIIVYSWTILFFKPVAVLISKFRYLTMIGVTFLFIAITGNLGEVKLDLLIFGIVPYFTTSFLSIVCSIPQQQLDKARINGLNRWETLYEVIVVGRLDQLLEIMRQNFAISWMMITAVEGGDMSEGGLGTLMIKDNKHLNIASVFALLIIVLLFGMFFDWVFSYLRKVLFTYVKK